MEDYRQKIKQEATARGITHLLHFTSANNAASILSNGLVSRTILETLDIPFHASDTMRLDEHCDSVSVSIHSINEAMFEAKKRACKERNWLIIALDASILWTHACRFCWKNASCREIRNHTGSIKGPWAFAKMFEDEPVSSIDRSSFRDTHQRAACEPTDNAAEVQVLDPIAVISSSALPQGAIT